MSLFKKIGAERNAAQDALISEPGRKIHDSTLVHIGANPSYLSDIWRTAYDLIVRQIVKSPALNQAHVPQWMSLSSTQSHLQQLADALIAGAPVPSHSRAALISSYMEASGDNYSRASDFIDLVSSVLVAGLMGGVKDDALSAQLQVSVIALQRRFDNFDQRLAAEDTPEPGWSFDVACKANEEWLKNVFSNSSKAKRRLGQPLSPADTTGAVPSVSRTKLAESLDRLLLESPLGGIVAVTGNEGNGKSWLVAQTWLSWTVKPLTLFLTAEDVIQNIFDPLVLIARKLCDQTDRHGDESHQEFWSKQLRAWRKLEAGQTLRLMVVLDGLNQRPGTEWSRAINLLSDELERICGKLILTSRKRYFDGLVKPSLVSACRELPVPEWTVSERDELLAVRGISSNQLHKEVAASLCNPRLLSVALRLLDRAQLQAMEELSISLLLFEHLRASHQDSYGLPVSYFARSLQDHAKKILKRLDAKQLGDFNVFEGGLDAVVEGRFFAPLANDLTRYTIHNEGLGLALGLAIIDELRAALRNQRDFHEVLALLTEPIAALDQTSEAILAALTVACVTEEHSPEIGTAILIAFASVQNPDEHSFSAFSALARVRPQVFVGAAHTLALQGGTVVNFDWIELALHQAKSDCHAWKVLSPAIESWLAHVSLDVEWRVFSTGKSTDEVTEQLAQSLFRFDATLAAFSIQEQDIFETLVQTAAPDVSVLGRLALTLLAGQPLAPFSYSLVMWSFARSLNGNHQAPMKQFRHLVRFNRNDWSTTRQALLQCSQRLRKDSTSNVGKWALVALLDATGNPDDAREAQELVNSLRSGQTTYPGWHRNERYCLTDPCDPNNVEPENVAKTAGEYAEIDVKKLLQYMGQNEQDLFFNDARPALARYFPHIATDRHRALIDDMFSRTGTPLRQIVFGLLDHSALISLEQANHIVRRACGSEADIEARDSLGNDAGTWTLFQLELAFPALDAIDQLEVLLQASLGTELSDNLIELIKPLDVEHFEAALGTAIAALDIKCQFTVLLFAPFVKQPLSNVMHDFIPVLLRSEATFVRAYTLHLIAKSEDARALYFVVQSPIERTDQTSWESELEHWNYSAVLLAAALQGIASWETLAAKMSLRHVACLATRLGLDVVQYFANAVDELLNLALGMQVESDTLEIEIALHPGTHSRPHIFSVREREPQQASFDDVMRGANENERDFDEHQTNLNAAFLAFRASISNRDVGELLNQLSLDEFPSLVEIDTVRLKQWCELLLAAPSGAKLGATRNLALHLAREISARDTVTAVRMFEKFDPIRPLVRNMFGRSGIELGAMAVWSASDGAEINALRNRRLDRAINNDELAREVWAALWQGKSYILTQYIDVRLNSTWPAAQSRAILTAGFMGENQHSSAVLSRFAGVPGLLGETQRIAHEFYQRHIWAMHWYAIMRRASSTEEFWRAAVLFRVVADGRIEALTQFSDTPTTTFLLYWPGARRLLNNRFDKLRNKLKKKLFADEAPQSLFISFSDNESGSQS